MRQGQDSNLRVRRHPLTSFQDRKVAGEPVNHSGTLTGCLCISAGIHTYNAIAIRIPQVTIAPEVPFRAYFF